MIELVVCDMAGTTVHDGDGVNAAFQSALAAVGVRPDSAAVNRVMGLNKPEAIQILLESAGRPATREQIDRIHDDFVRRMREHYEKSGAVREIPGAAESFARLRRAGIKVALNSGFHRMLVDVLLERLGWTPPEGIDAAIASNEVPRGRPHPDMIRALMARFDIQKPEHVAKIGDTRADLEEGANSGCLYNIGVTSGTHTRAQLQICPHTHIVESIREAADILLAAR